MSRVSPMVGKIGFNPRSSHTKDFFKKWYLMRPSLTLKQHFKQGSRVKWSNPGNGVAPSPTPRCSSYWKESFRVTLDYSRQLYLFKKKKKKHKTMRIKVWAIILFTFFRVTSPEFIRNFYLICYSVEIGNWLVIYISSLSSPKTKELTRLKCLIVCCWLFMKIGQLSNFLTWRLLRESNRVIRGLTIK